MTTRASVAARPLSAAAFRAFGDVIEASASAGLANQGTARRRDRVAAVVGDRPGATLNVAVFRCAARPLPISIAMLEKHPRSTQAFVPMNATRYLIVVAGGASEPDLATLSAFVADGRQGVAYGPGVWHHPMIALDRETDFVCLVHEDGTAEDCVEHALSSPIAIAVEALP